MSVEADETARAPRSSCVVSLGGFMGSNSDTSEPTNLDLKRGMRVVMCRYVYGFNLRPEDREIFFRFPGFPEIISAIDLDTFRAMGQDEIENHAHDAIITALQAVIAFREDVPAADDPALVHTDGFVHLSVSESMKLELFRIYKTNCKSVAAFARLLGNSETAARRLLDLRHGSRPTEIEKAVKALGKRLVHDWSLEARPQADARVSESLAGVNTN